MRVLIGKFLIAIGACLAFSRDEDIQGLKNSINKTTAFDNSVNLKKITNRNTFRPMNDIDTSSVIKCLKSGDICEKENFSIKIKPHFEKWNI